MIEMSNNYFYESKNNFWSFDKEKKFLIKKRHVVGRRNELVGNILKNVSSKESFFMRELGIMDMFHVKGFAERYLNRLLLVWLIFMYF